MKVLVLTFRNSLDAEVRSLLTKEDIRAYSEIPSVHGIGEAGPAFGSLTCPGKNSMILIALPDDRADQLIKAFETFRHRLATQQHGVKLPIKLFVLPCEQII